MVNREDPLASPAVRSVVVTMAIPQTTTGRGRVFITNDPDKVWLTGLTLKEAEEVHSYLIDGTRVFGVIALIAHLLVAVSTPWLG